MSENVTPWLIVHYGGAIGFPRWRSSIWLLIRDLPGRAATIARCRAAGLRRLLRRLGGDSSASRRASSPTPATSLSGAEREGAAAAVDAIITSPIVGESGVFVSIGSLAWWIAISAAIMALKHAGVRRSALVLLGLGGLMAFHVPIGPPALVCLSIAAYMIERDRGALVAA